MENGPFQDKWNCILCTNMVILHHIGFIAVIHSIARNKLIIHASHVKLHRSVSILICELESCTHPNYFTGSNMWVVSLVSWDVFWLKKLSSKLACGCTSCLAVAGYPCRPLSCNTHLGYLSHQYWHAHLYYNLGKVDVIHIQQDHVDIMWHVPKWEQHNWKPCLLMNY